MLGNLCLYGEYICNISVVCLCPQMLICPGINQLADNPDSSSGALDTALQNGCHSQFTGYLNNGLIAPLVLHGGGAGNDL